MKLIKNIIFQIAIVATCILGFSFDASSTHIVGGDMTYKCLGNERYEITLTVRRDCAFGSPFAPFDNPASIGFFDSNGDLDFDVGIAGQVLIPFVQDDTLNFQINSDCGFVGAPICVHEATYTKVVRLPFRPGGYTAAYQRCCRNGTLNNIVGPLETGSTYFIEFTEEALQVCNSSPVFNQWPDIYICANEVLNFKHFAIDADGDDLVYSLCNPHEGAEFNNPKPQPPNGPEYTNVTYLSPYTALDPLGGTPLTIDPVTGEMSAIPNLIGQFLVGICVEEFRDGVLLSRVIRDFEYNVRVCSDAIVADFDVDPVICGVTEVAFDNTSQGADSYIWHFDYPNPDPAFTSSDENPIFDYQDYGTYVVQLEAIRSVDGCSSFSLDTILVTDTAVDADFTANFYSCENDIYILELEDLTNLSMGMSNITSLSWTITQAGQIYVETGNLITLEINNPDNLTIVLDVLLTNGCMASLTKTVVLETISLDAEITASIDGCSEDDITYTIYANNLPTGIPSVSWTINDGNNTNSFSGNPIMYTTPNLVISGTLETISTNCVSTQSFFVNTADVIPRVDIDYSVAGCNNLGLLKVNLNALVTNIGASSIINYEWIVVNGSTINLSGNPQELELDPSLDGEVILNVTLDNNCVYSDTLSVEKMNPFDFEYTQSITLCKTDNYELSIPQASGTTILWASNELLQNPLNSFDQIIEIPADHVTGTETLLFTITDANGCEMEFDILVNVDVHPSLFVTHTDIDCDSYSACFENISPVITPVEWTFTDDDGNVLGTSTDIMPCFTFPGIGEYHITLSGQNDSCPGVPFVYCVVFNDPMIEITNHQSEINACLGDEIILQATTSMDNDSIKWCDISSGTEVLLGTGPSLILEPTNGQEIVAKISEIKGCVEFSEIIKFNVDDLNLGEFGELLACKEDLFILDIFNGSSYNFVWESNDLIIAGENTPNPTISIPATLANGTYLLNFQVSNGSCSQSQTLILKLIDDPILAFDYFISDCTDFTVCFNSTSNISNSLVWDFGDSSFNQDESTELSPCYTYGTEGVYKVSLMLEGGACAGSSISTDVIVGLPVIEIVDLDVDGNVVFCSSEQIELVAEANVLGTISWFDNSGNLLGQGTSLFIDPIEGMEVSVSILSLNGCESEQVSTILVDKGIDLDLSSELTVCRGNTGQLTISTSLMLDYNWNAHPLLTAGLDTPNPTYAIPSDYPLGSTFLSFTAHNNEGCNDVFQLELNVIDGEVLSFTYEITDCDSYTVCFENTSGTGNSVSWDFGDTSNTSDTSTDQNPCYSYSAEGSYDVSMTTTNGDCAGASTLLTIDVVKPIIEILNLDINGNTVFCSMEMIELTASSVSTGTITWYDSNGATLGTGTSIMITPFAGTEISASIVAENGCESDRVTTTLIDGSLDLDIFSPLEVCRASVRDLVILTSQNVTFEWTAHPLLIDGLDTANPTISVPADYPLGTVVLTFTAFNELGCSGDFSYEIIVGDGETLTFDYTVTDCDNFTVCFENTSGSSSVVTWDFGDPNSTTDISNDQNPCYTYGADGLYMVTMTTLDGACPGSDVTMGITTEKPIIEILNLDINGNTVFCSMEMIELTASSVSTGTITWYDSNGATLGTGTSIMLTPFAGTEISASIVAENGCESDRVTTTLIDGSLDLDIFSPLEVCRASVRDLVILTSQNVTFEWTAHPLLIDGLDTANPTISVPADYPLGTVVLTFTAFNELGCSGDFSYEIIVGDGETLTFDYTVTDCDNFTVCFENTSGSSSVVTWDFGDPNSTTDISNDQNPCYTYGADGLYMVTMTTLDGACPGSDVTMGITTEKPIIEILNLDINGNTVFCSMEMIELTASSVSTGTITWYDSNGATLGTGTSIMLTPFAGTEISASIVAENGCESDRVTTTLIDGSLDLDLFQPISLCRGDSRNLVVLTTQNVVFDWDVHPLLTSGLDTASPSVTIPSDYPLGSVVFTFSASNDIGCADTFTYEIMIVDNEPLSFTYEVTDCENFEVCFTNTSSMNGILFWDFGDLSTTDDVSPDNNPCYIYPGPGTYQVTLNTIGGSCSGIPDTLDVILNAVPDIEILNLPDTVFVCNTEPISVSASTNLPGGTIEWCDSNGGVLGAGPSIEIMPDNNITLIAKAIDPNGCSYPSEPVVFIVGDLELDYTSPLDVCKGDTLTLDINPQTGITFAWNASPYIISGQNTGSPVIYIDPSENITSLVLGFVASNNNGCGGQFEYEINVIDNVIMNFDYEVTDCNDYTVCFDNTSGVTGSINWDFGDLSTTTDVSMDNMPCYTYPGSGTYTVSLSSDTLTGACMSVPFSMDITLNELPFITLDTSMMDQTVCLGDTITLSGSSYLDIPINWCLSDGTPLGMGDVIDVEVNMDMNIIAKLTDTNGCIDTSIVTDIDVYQFDLTVVNAPVFCGLDTAIITIIDNANNTNLTYQWAPDECILSGGDTPTPVVTAAVSKDLMVVVTDTTTGCVSELTVPITVSDIEISVTEDFTVIQGNSGTIEVLGADIDDEILWSNGSTEVEQEVTPLETTTYTVTVTDPNGCTATAQVTITVDVPRCDDEAVFIPTAFSPNGDGNNDVLYVRGLYIESMELIIFNRWGQEVFKTTDQRVGWDGTFNGEPLSPDSYAFCIRAACINGEENIRTGNVSLLR